MKTVIIDFTPELEKVKNQRREITRRRSQIRRKKQRNIILITIVAVITALILTWHFARSSMVEMTIVDDVPYVVEAGDTLWGITKKYCPDDMDIREYIRLTMEYNNCTSNIDIGQVIQIPIYDYTLKK